MSQVRASGFIIFRRQKSTIEFLLLQASYREHHWSPPKGHLEKGEDDITAAYRELQEESGILNNMIKLLNFHDELRYSVDGKPKIVTYRLAELIEENFNVIISHEAQCYKWAGLEEACKLAHFPDMISLLKKSYAFILAN